MSILSSFYHGETRTNPNATHNGESTEQMEQASQAMNPPVAQLPPSDDQAEAEGEDARQQEQMAFEAVGRGLRSCTPPQAQAKGHALNAMHGAQQRYSAQLEGELRGDLYYTTQEVIPGVQGWVESPHTVASKLESKEEYPQG